jgi:predicted transcriptional regulator
MQTVSFKIPDELAKKLNQYAATLLSKSRSGALNIIISAFFNKTEEIEMELKRQKLLQKAIWFMEDYIKEKGNNNYNIVIHSLLKNVDEDEITKKYIALHAVLGLLFLQLAGNSNIDEERLRRLLEAGGIILPQK